MKRQHARHLRIPGDLRRPEHDRAAGRTIPRHENFGFLDWTTAAPSKSLQVVLEREELEKLRTGRHARTSARRSLPGHARALTPDAPQPFELKETVTVEGVSSPDYPLQKKAPQRRVSAHDPSISGRARTFCSPRRSRVRSVAAAGRAHVLPGRGFVAVHGTPHHHRL